MGWFFGFKLHILVNRHAHIISFSVTKGNCDDRHAPDTLFDSIFGTLFGDRGYLGEPFYERMQARGVHIITELKKNMKKTFLVPKDVSRK